MIFEAGAYPPELGSSPTEPRWSISRNVPFGLPEDGTNRRRVKLALPAGPVTVIVTFFAEPLPPPASR
ncbi:hypothetical protein [Pseudonocardia sp. EV170527-09]|uniref:hypothetical protein n=1 Tax=Pseudonocardia sp. EV170527-09 TaxID=2603411 RepID=UPI001F008FF9|nr:hypothetical protein [Pseudonocardia sp. EV170527-09]